MLSPRLLIGSFLLRRSEDKAQMNEIAQVLTTIFKKHRIVFLYDARKKLRLEFEAPESPGIETIEFKSNEFGTKHHALREKSNLNISFVSRTQRILCV